MSSLLEALVTETSIGSVNRNDSFVNQLIFVPFKEVPTRANL